LKQTLLDSLREEDLTLFQVRSGLLLVHAKVFDNHTAQFQEKYHELLPNFKKLSKIQEITISFHKNLQTFQKKLP